MRKTVDIYLRNRLVASYPVVLEEIDRPTDDDFIGHIKRYMRRHYSSEEIDAARFVVRSHLD